MTAPATAVRARPILMSGPMVRPTLDGTKGQTRRTRGLDRINEQPNAYEFAGWGPTGAALFRLKGSEAITPLMCPYGQTGDRLWVRETWNAQLEWPEGPGDFRMRWWQDVPRGFRGPKNCVRLHYAADNAEWELLCDDDGNDVMISPAGWPARANKWRPSIHMPRWASRITLELTGVRVERVQDISEADCWAEGIERSGESPTQASTTYSDYASPRRAYNLLWNSLNAKRGYGWDVNPWVWVLEFRGVAAPGSGATP